MIILPSRREPSTRKGRGRFLLVAALFATALSLVPVHPSHAAVLTVIDLGNSGQGTLREAIATASPGDVIKFDPSILPGTIILTSGELAIDKALTVEGPGSELLTISGNESSRVFNVIAGVGPVLISGITIADGRAGGDGGGIYNSGTLALTRVVIADNRGSYGGGVFNPGNLTITESTISDNVAFGDNAGGIHSTGSLELFRSTVSGNRANRGGGGIASVGPVTRIINSTISGNSVTSATQAYGGGIWSGDMVMSYSTITNNTSAFTGGGLFIQGEVDLVGTLIAGNSAAAGPDCQVDPGVIVSHGSNLIGNLRDCSFTPGPGDIVGTEATPSDPMLLPIADNGGPTPTHAFAGGSPAIDAAGCLDSAGSAVLVDQRMVARPQGPACDVGALELELEPPEPVPVTTWTGLLGLGLVLLWLSRRRSRATRAPIIR